MVSAALTASAAGLTYGYGWKGARAIYLPGGMNEQSFGEDGLLVHFMLNDFGGYIGWFSIVPVLVVVLFAGITGPPGFQGVVELHGRH
ncbi:hypothetical protein ABZ892_24180 [Streptomyces sp. NPDC046924]|uniref:hypothetical protein n=1 Tax=Streptomyces sp. NPDC046924 TaxID=3155136 RepID=UPI0034036550